MKYEITVYFNSGGMYMCHVDFDDMDHLYSYMENNLMGHGKKMIGPFGAPAIIDLSQVSAILATEHHGNSDKIALFKKPVD